MQEYIVAKASEIPIGKGKVVFAGNLPIVVFNVSGNFYAIENSCPHAGGPLGNGQLEGDFVICPWHGWAFNVKTGESDTGATAKTFPVKVDEKTGEIKIIVD